MNEIRIVVAIIVVFYLGTAIGLYSLCVENPTLLKAKKYVLYVPVFTLLCIFYGLFCGNKNYRRTVIRFLKIPHKTILLLYFFAEVVALEKEKTPKKSPKKKEILGGVVNLFPELSTKSAVFNYTYY